MTKEDYQTEYNYPVPNGILMIIGGAEQKEMPDEQTLHKTSPEVIFEVLGKFISLIQVSNPIIEVVTTAAYEDVVDTYKCYKTVFEMLKACTVNHMHHDKREDINEQETEERLKSAHAVFLAGGDQLKLTSIYGGTRFVNLIKKRYLHEQLIIAGTSAGAMSLSTAMIFAGNGADEMIAAEVKTTTGFEFIKDVCIDTHFVQRGRFVRMAQVIATNPAITGIGIEEDTAIIVKDSKHAVVVGSGVVIIIDGKESRLNNVTEFDEKKKITIANLKVSLFSKGAEFEILQ